MSETASHPPGEYAIVELFGHTTLVGRISEVERFGTKMLALEPLFCDHLLPVVLHGGAAIYRMTPCDAATAWAKQPRSEYHLPAAIRCIVPPLLLTESRHETTIAIDDAADDNEHEGEGSSE